MRRIDKKLNMIKANMLAEQRYLESKGLLSEMMYPVNAGGEEKIAFAEGDENIRKIDGEGTSVVGQPGYNPDGDNQLEEGLVKNIIMGAVAICSFGSCEKTKDTDVMYKYVYDTEKSLELSVESHAEIRSTHLVPSKPLEDDINEYNKIINSERERFHKEGIYPIGDTIIRLEDNTVKSPFMHKDKYGKVVVDQEKVNKALGK